jgi:hypothetical protein
VAESLVTQRFGDAELGEDGRVGVPKIVSAP